MKTAKIILSIGIMLAISGLNEATGQWATNGSNIYNTNTGNVGIGNSSPATLLYVAKNMTEPAITVRNLGGAGGATFRMWDNASGADWKFKATNAGGFKIRDNAYALDVFTIESNSSANALYINSAGSVGIGTATPASSALVDMTSTTKAFSLPRMTQAQIGAISSPANGLVVFCTTDNKIYAFVASASTWKEILLGSGTISPTPSCGSSITINHVAGNVAPVTKTVTYGTVTNIPGETSKCWITSNLGSDHQATAATDATEASAGWYWQFNHMQGFKHDGATRTPNATWITPISENSDWIAANDPCNLELGSGWRVPTSTEWTNVQTNGGWANRNDTWNSALKIHAAGYLEISAGSLIARGNYGAYWSSSQFTDITRGLSLYLKIDICIISNYSKANGFTSRCLKD